MGAEESSKMAHCPRGPFDPEDYTIYVSLRKVLQFCSGPKMPSVLYRDADHTRTCSYVLPVTDLHATGVSCFVADATGQGRLLLQFIRYYVHAQL